MCMLGSTNGTAEHRRQHRLSLLGQHEVRGCLIALDQTLTCIILAVAPVTPAAAQSVSVAMQKSRSRSDTVSEAAIDSVVGVLVAIFTPDVPPAPVARPL
jgi:hypothetical protein